MEKIRSAGLHGGLIAVGVESGDGREAREAGSRYVSLADPWTRARVPGSTLMADDL